VHRKTFEGLTGKAYSLERSPDFLAGVIGSKKR